MKTKEELAKAYCASGTATSDRELNQLLLKEKFEAFIAGYEAARKANAVCVMTVDEMRESAKENREKMQEMLKAERRAAVEDAIRIAEHLRPDNEKGEG